MTVVGHARLRFEQLAGRRSADPLDGVDAASSVRIVRLRRAPDRRAHVHPRSEEIVYVVAGSGHVWIDGVTEPVEAGDVIRIPPGAAHATLPDSGADMELVCFFPDPDLASNTTETTIIVDPHQRGERSS